MKSFLLKAFFSLLLISPAQADVFRVEGIDGGIHDNVPGNMTEDGEFVDMTNFHSDPFSHGIIQREGSIRQNSTQLSGKKAVDVFTYVQQDGDEFLLSFTSKTWSYSTNDGSTWTGFLSTATDGAVYDCTTFIDDNEYCVSQNDGGFRFNGSDDSTAGSMPAAKYIEQYQNRLFSANTAANPGRLFFSGLIQATTWTVSTDFIDFPEAITGIGEPFDNGLPIYTANSTWILRGDDPTNFFVQQISGKIGCANNRTIKNHKIKDKEYQVFLSKGANQTENNMYALDGVTVFPIGNKYLTLLSQINIGNANAREKIWTDQDDFSAGTVGVGLTITDSPGNVRFSTNGIVMDNFGDGDYTSLPQWNPFSSPVNNTFAVTSGRATSVGSNAGGFYSTFTAVSNGIWEAVFQSDVARPGFEIGISTGPNAVMANGPTSGGGQAASGTGYVFTVIDQDATTADGIGPITEISKVTGGVKTSLNTCVVQQMNTGTDYKLSIAISTTGKIVGNFNGSDICGADDTTYRSFNALTMLGNLNRETQITTQFDDVTKPTTTAVFQSEHVAIGSGAPTWGPVSIAQVINALDINYAVYSDSDTSINIANSSTFISSQAVSNGTVPTIAFSSYTLFTSSFNRTTVVGNPTLASLSLNWNLESGNGDQPDAEIYKGNYWMTYTGGSESRNQSMLVINRENSAYTMEYGTSSQNGFFGLTTSNGRLFGGDSLSDTTGGGYVWWLESGNLDNGQPVSSTATLKHNEFKPLEDYQKSLIAVYLNYEVGTGTFTTTVLKNFGESSSSFSIPFASGTVINRYKIVPPQQTVGKQIGLRFHNETSDQRLKIYPPITYHIEKIRLIPVVQE